MTEKESLKKRICEHYGNAWKGKNRDIPPEGDKCEACLLKWKCRKAGRKEK